MIPSSERDAAAQNSYRGHRQWLDRQLNPAARSRGISPINGLICALIVGAVALTVLETEPTLVEGRERLFREAELVFAALFAVEFTARGWCAGGSQKGLARWRSRILWLVTPGALLDLAALIPTLLIITGAPVFALRLVRIVRILRIARLGRFSRAGHLLSQAVFARRYELLVTLTAALTFMLISASLMYWIEGSVQPQRFGSIPRALWWAAVTLTTIGYGDVTPVTPLGRLLAAVTAMGGIGLVAAPTGILAAAFSDAAKENSSGTRKVAD